MRFLKSSSLVSKNSGGGFKAKLSMSKQKLIFFSWMASFTSSILCGCAQWFIAESFLIRKYSEVYTVHFLTLDDPYLKHLLHHLHKNRSLTRLYVSSGAFLHILRVILVMYYWSFNAVLVVECLQSCTAKLGDWVGPTRKATIRSVRVLRSLWPPKCQIWKALNLEYPARDSRYCDVNFTGLFIRFWLCKYTVQLCVPINQPDILEEATCHILLTLSIQMI